MAFAPPTISLAFFGVKALTEIFELITDMALKENRRGDWYVVSVVGYGEVLEWRDPHWRFAIQQLADDITIDTAKQQDMLNAMIAGGSLTKEMIVRLAGRIRKLIRQKGLIDTGNYIGSIAIGDSMGAAVAQSNSQLLDPDTSVLSL